MMTRKDYVETANVLQSAVSIAKWELEENSKELFFALEQVQFIAENFAKMFASDNPRFDEERFFSAVWKEN